MNRKQLLANIVAIAFMPIWLPIIITKALYEYIREKPEFESNAMALPSGKFRPILSQNQKVKDIDRLKAFVNHVEPGADVMLFPPEKQPEIEPVWERIPFKWNGKNVYIRKSPIKRSA